MTKMYAQVLRTKYRKKNVFIFFFYGGGGGGGGGQCCTSLPGIKLCIVRFAKSLDSLQFV